MTYGIIVYVHVKDVLLNALIFFFFLGLIGVVCICFHPWKSRLEGWWYEKNGVVCICFQPWKLRLEGWWYEIKCEEVRNTTI